MKPPSVVSSFGIALVGALAFSLITAKQAFAVTYMFENLNTGTLAGQDNWTTVGPGGSSLVGTGSGFNTSKVLQNPGTGGAHFTIRQNNLGFSFGTFYGTETNAVLEFDVRVNSTPLVNENVAFYVGDVNGNVSSSPQIQYGNTGTGVNPIFAVVKANATGSFSASLPGTVSFGDWVRVRLTMDFTANAGDGFGSVTMANLTQSTGYTAVTGLQNLALGMSNGAVNEAAWDAMWTRTDLASSMTADNLTVIVPEPGSSILALMGILFAGFGRRRR